MDNYNYQGYGQYMPPRDLPNATAVLILGIASIVGCFCYGFVGVVCAVVALILANGDLKLYHANPGHYSVTSYNNLNAGRICAIIGIILSMISFLFIIIAVIANGLGVLTHMEDWNR